MKTPQELWQLLSETENMQYGPARTALAEELLRHVDSAGDQQLSFGARLIATNSFAYGGEPAKAFVTFSWCISDLDDNPQPYHERALFTLLWLFKTMVNALTKFPEIPLARTYAALDDMERRYQEYGQGMQALYKYRYVIADHIGSRDDADQWFARWQAAPRDNLSDCIGCDPSDVAEYLSSRGRFAEAVEHAEPVLAGELTCIEQPQRVLNELMVPYLESGRQQEAADAHRRSYRLERNNVADMSDIASHIAFCARTGNENRGLEILQRHLDWLDKAPSPAAEMELAAAGGLLLRRITELGHGDTPIQRRDRADAPAAEVAAELRERAIALARRFDERNGTDAQGRRTAARLDAEPFSTPVNLSPSARTAAPAPPEPLVAPEPLPEVPAEAGPAELIDLAKAHYDEDREAAFTATMDALDARFPVVDDPLLAGRRAVQVGNRLRLGGQDGALEVWSEAAELLTKAGAPGEAGVLRARIALEQAFAGEIDEEPIRADVSYQDEHGGPAERAAAWGRLSILHAVQNRLDEANEAGDRGYALAEQTGDGRRIAEHAMVRARNRVSVERFEEARADGQVAWDFYREHGPASRLAEAAALCGHLAAEPAEQIEAFTVVIAAAGDELALPARLGRARALMLSDRAAEAIPDLVEAVAIAAEHNIEEGGAFARAELADAYRLVGRPIEAAEVAEEALTINERLGLTEAANNNRFLLAGLHRDLDDRAGALAGYRDLIERLADNPSGRGQVREEAAKILYELDRDAEAADEFATGATDLAAADDPIGELRLLRRQVGALHFADDPERAEEAARLAVRKCNELSPQLATESSAIWESSMIAFEFARLLMTRNRWAEALPHLPGVPERLRSIGMPDEANRLECMLGEALLRTGSAPEAEAVLRPLLERLPANVAMRGQVAGLLAEAEKATGDPSAS
jgi:hypothetical protein